MLPSLGSLKLSNAAEQINMHADARSQRVESSRMLYTVNVFFFIIIVGVSECSEDGDHAAATTKKLI